MKKLDEILEKRWVANALAICSGVLLFMILSNLNAVSDFFRSIFKLLEPILIGAILAYLIDPVTMFFEQKVYRKIKKENIKHSLSVICAIIFVLLLIVLFFVAVIPSLIDSITIIINNASNYAEVVNSLIDQINSWNMGFNLDLSTLSGYLETILTESFSYLTNNAENILNVSRDIGSSVFNVIIGFILCVYFLTGKKTILSGINELRSAAFSQKRLQKHNTFWSRCHSILIQYIGYDLLDGLIVGFANAFVMLTLRMPYVALISVIVGVTNLLPTFGPLIGLVFGGLILLLNSPRYALWFVIIIVSIQTLDGYVLKPKLFGGALGIPPVWTLISIILGGKLFGVAGIILAIPFAAVISFLYTESFLPWLKNRNKA